MANTKAGGLKTRDTNIRKYGASFYSDLGTCFAKAYRERKKLGIAKPRGFVLNPEIAREAGRKGGRISRRRKVLSDG